MAKAGVNKVLANWLGNHDDRWLSYMIHNNYPGVLEYLHARPDIEIKLDANADGKIEPNEVYTDIIGYFKGDKLTEFVADMKKRVQHNDNADAKWNLYKNQ